MVSTFQLHCTSSQLQKISFWDIVFIFKICPPHASSLSRVLYVPFWKFGLFSPIAPPHSPKKEVFGTFFSFFTFVLPTASFPNQAKALKVAMYILYGPIIMYLSEIRTFQPHCTSSKSKKNSFSGYCFHFTGLLFP